MAITGVTRRSLFADLRNSGWWGDCADEVEFLSSLYDLTDLPSTDGRYANAREDLVQHRVSNSDWDDLDLFADARFKLSAAGDDEPLLRFLARTVHPEVVVSVDEVAARVVAYNGHLRPDGWELYQVDRISGRPVYGWRTVRPPTIGLEHIRASIANAIAEGFKSYQVAEFCTDVVGLPPPKDGLEDPHSSKRGYVRRRIDMKNRGELLDIADRVLTLVEDPDLSEVVDAVRAAGDKPSRLGPVKQLIFAANGPKPKIVFSDAIHNDVRIVENAEFCLVYSEPIGDSGLSWRQLVRWWSLGSDASERDSALQLHTRLLASLQEGPERWILTVYAKLYKRFGFDIPALIPQVYLHYDPYLRRQGMPANLPRQRMDFLLLVPSRRRVVIELDGKQHYSTGDGRASPTLYGEMMREDRRLRLTGYELFRIGGGELPSRADAEPVLREFFVDLLQFYDVTLDA